MMQFYMTPGSCSTGIHILLEELELVFSAHVVNLPAGDQYKPEFVAINPKSTIPVLVLDSGIALTSFVSIAWWLAANYPKAKLLPEGLDEQAQTIDLVNFIVESIHGQGFTRIFTTERYSQNKEDFAQISEYGKQLVKKNMALLEPYLNKTDGYLFGEFSIADAALFYVEFWASRIDLPMPKACEQHLALMRKRPVVQRVLMEEGYYR